MTDRRRSRWIAFDAMFFDGTVGVMLRDRFGTAGVVVFLAFLCGCKRNLVQGQIEYGSDSDALAQLGLSGLRLVDDEGQEWTLDTLWRALGDHKQIRRTSRGRLIQVRSTNWERWQETYVREKEASRKSSSRATNTPDDAPPKGRRSTAERSPETDTDTDTDTPPPQVPPGAANGSRPGQEEEGDRAGTACKLVARRKLDDRDGERVNNVPAWLKKTADNLRTEHAELLAQLTADGATVRAMIDAIDPPPPSPYPKPGEQRPPTFSDDDLVLDDDGRLCVRSSSQGP